MIYRFRSPATGDLVMLAATGDEILRLLGREPAAKGIFESAALTGAIERLQAAIAAAEAPVPAGEAADDDSSRPAAVSLRQRAWPLIEMFKRAREAGEPVVWGV